MTSADGATEADTADTTRVAVPTSGRPAGVPSVAVDAVGKLSESFERLIRARGHLYSFHQLLGGVDFMLDDAAQLFRDAGMPDVADEIERELIGRNVLEGRWTFQIVEEFDDTYYEPFANLERRLCRELMGGQRHVFESELKDQRRTKGHPRHARRPGDED